jgi:RNA polymerase sigma-70 factor, ECF subfamily
MKLILFDGPCNTSAVFHIIALFGCIASECKVLRTGGDYLVVKARPGNAEKFEALMQSYAPALQRLCSAYRKEPDGCEDLFQEIAIGLWKALPNRRGDSSERTWFYRIAHNIAITDSIRLRRRESREVALDDQTLTGTLLNDRRADLLAAVQQLNAIDREFALLYLEGLTTREIGDVLGIREGSAAVRLTRLRQRLTQMLNPQETKA